MKLKHINNISLLSHTKDNLEVNITDAIVSDEFNQKGVEECYRKRAIKRLVKERLPISNNCNVAFTLVRDFISIKCPYCGSQMKKTDGGGSSHITNHNFTCENCKSGACLTLMDNFGLNFFAKDES